MSPDSPAQQLEYLEGIDSGAFSVGDFRVPLMRAEIDPVARPGLRPGMPIWIWACAT
jgi:hypothetical protein